MDRQKRNKKLVDHTNKLSSWEGAIELAERRLQYHKIRVADLKGVVSLYRKLRDSGEVWPGEELVMAVLSHLGRKGDNSEYKFRVVPQFEIGGYNEKSGDTAGTGAKMAAFRWRSNHA